MTKEDKKIAKIIAEVMPAVVSITINKTMDEVKREIENLSEGKDLGPVEIPPEKIDSEGMVEVGGGSGFIADPIGIILTNRHVINEPNAAYKVITNDGVEYKAELIAQDSLNDIAMLKVGPYRSLPYLKLGDSKKARLGETVLTFGNALGIFKNTVSKGIISGLARAVSAKADPSSAPEELHGLIQTDAAINPGNSGGPLINIEGEVIGINAAVVADAQNISFAIPINSAKKDLIDYKKYGRIKTPYLGLRYVAVNRTIKDEFNLSVDYGAYVTGENNIAPAVVPGGPAEKASIRKGDVLLEWNGEKITTDKSVVSFLNDSNAGDVVKLKLLRGGKIFETALTLEERG